MIIVSDTSPISNLFIVGKLNLLREIFGSIILPHAVYEELLVLQESGFEVAEITNTPWIEVRTIKNRIQIDQFLSVIDLGETEAIILAKELDADLLLVDESMGRKVAVEQGLKTIGLLGTLIEAKSLGLIPEVKTTLDELRTKANFRVKDDLYKLVLERAGEIQ